MRTDFLSIPAVEFMRRIADSAFVDHIKAEMGRDAVPVGTTNFE